MAHIAVVTALLVAVGTVMNVAAGCHHYFVLCSSLVCGCWLTYAGYAHLAASRGVPLARVEHVFVGLCIFHHTTCILLYDGLRMTPILGRSVISEFQIFLVALAAAYAQLNVRHCAVIACAGMLGATLNTALVLARDFPLLSRLEIGERLYVFISLAMLEAVVVFVSVRINTTLRTAYHYCRTVEADASDRKLATTERERMLQHEAEVELKLRNAEAAKAARGSLIRMVGPIAPPPLYATALPRALAC
ncbi:hypothetical protein T492DRAFT_236699 [Pavlovales sp. CCMP2436]|nr:hypothetical protein T492DRAFT_236699 [Pavlovales sp. CCMP2436]